MSSALNRYTAVPAGDTTLFLVSPVAPVKMACGFTGPVWAPVVFRRLGSDLPFMLIPAQPDPFASRPVSSAFVLLLRHEIPTVQGAGQHMDVVPLPLCRD